MRLGVAPKETSSPALSNSRVPASASQSKIAKAQQLLHACPANQVRMSEHSSHHSRDPLHGITLERLLTELVAHYGWAEMGQRVPIRCFTHDPSIKSSLTFLRKTPWARAKVEDVYVRWKLTGT
jgi:hypothetical protein